MAHNRLSKAVTPRAVSPRNSARRGALITRRRCPGRSSFSNVKAETREKEREKERRARACLAFWTAPRGRAYCTIVAYFRDKCQAVFANLSANSDADRIAFRCEPMTRREKYLGPARENAPFVDCKFHGANARLYTRRTT